MTRFEEPIAAPITPADTEYTRPDWDSYFALFAEVAGFRADCTRRQVGCVLVRDNRIQATGYNGAPAGRPGCGTAGACPRGRLSHDEVPAGADYNINPCIAVHAEANALIHSDIAKVRGATAYVTCPPCGQCEAQLAGAGIERVVVTTDVLTDRQLKLVELLRKEF